MEDLTRITPICREYLLKKSSVMSLLICSAYAICHPQFDEVVSEYVPDNRKTMFHKNYNYLIGVHDGIELSSIVNEIGLVQAIDHFHCYLGMMAALVFAKSPHLMKKINPKKYHTSITEGCGEATKAVQLLAWKLSDKLLLQETSKIISGFNETFVLDIGIESPLIKEADDGVLLRNALIHNWGRANARYLERSGVGGLAVGDKIPLPSTQELIHIVESLDTIVMHIDGAFVTKYGLKYFSSFQSQYDDSRVLEYSKFAQGIQ